jgi:hypothetical protein
LKDDNVNRRGGENGGFRRVESFKRK